MKNCRATQRHRLSFVREKNNEHLPSKCQSWGVCHGKPWQFLFQQIRHPKDSQMFQDLPNFIPLNHPFQIGIFHYNPATLGIPYGTPPGPPHTRPIAHSASRATRDWGTAGAAKRRSTAQAPGRTGGYFPKSKLMLTWYSPKTA